MRPIIPPSPRCRQQEPAAPTAAPHLHGRYCTAAQHDSPGRPQRFLPPARRATPDLRLGLQGIELLTTGRITLPVPEPHRAYLRSIRRGQRPLAEVVDAITSAEARLSELRDSPAIPDQPDRRWVDDWLHRSYLNFWAQRH